jgi:hypothetical protein
MEFIGGFTEFDPGLDLISFSVLGNNLVTFMGMLKAPTCDPAYWETTQLAGSQNS